MDINAISFEYAARFAKAKNAVKMDHIKGILIVPQQGGQIRLVATNGSSLVIVDDGAVNVGTMRKTWVSPYAPGLLSAVKKGDMVSLRDDGVVEVRKGAVVVYVSPAPCEDVKRVEDFPDYKAVIPRLCESSTRNYSLDTDLLSAFDLGAGVTTYQTGGNLDPLLVEPRIDLKHGSGVLRAIGVAMPLRGGHDSGYAPSKEHLDAIVDGCDL